MQRSNNQNFYITTVLLAFLAVNFAAQIVYAQDEIYIKRESPYRDFLPEITPTPTPTVEIRIDPGIYPSPYPTVIIDPGFYPKYTPAPRFTITRGTVVPTVTPIIAPTETKAPSPTATPDDITIEVQEVCPDTPPCDEECQKKLIEIVGGIPIDEIADYDFATGPDGAPVPIRENISTLFGTNIDPIAIIQRDEIVPPQELESPEYLEKFATDYAADYSDEVVKREDYRDQIPVATPTKDPWGYPQVTVTPTPTRDPWGWIGTPTPTATPTPNPEAEFCCACIYSPQGHGYCGREDGDRFKSRCEAYYRDPTKFRPYKCKTINAFPMTGGTGGNMTLPQAYLDWVKKNNCGPENTHVILHSHSNSGPDIIKDRTLPAKIIIRTCKGIKIISIWDGGCNSLGDPKAACDEAKRIQEELKRTGNCGATVVFTGANRNQWEVCYNPGQIPPDECASNPNGLTSNLPLMRQIEITCEGIKIYKHVFTPPNRWEFVPYNASDVATYCAGRDPHPEPGAHPYPRR